jgi:hypothetical protein
VTLALGEVREHDADEQGHYDHDDQWRLAGAEDPVHLDLFEVEDREQGDQYREYEQGAGACHLAAVATLTGGRNLC